MKTSIFPAALATIFLLTGAGCSTTTSIDTNMQTQPMMADDADTTNDNDDMIGGDAAKPPVEIDLNLNANGSITAEPVALSMNMESGNFFFKPDTINAKAGQQVNIKVDKNAGFHTFVIDAIKLKVTVKEDGTISFKAPTTPGSYEFYCDVGNHKAMGMKGTLIVK